MIQFLKYRYKLIKLEHYSKILYRKHETIEENGNYNSQEYYLELDDIARQMHDLDKCIDLLKTNYYHNRCYKLDIPLPEMSDNNYYQFNFDDDEGNRSIFTIEGLHSIRNLIRQEIKARYETIRFLISAIGKLIDIIKII
jgi:hypothetical protein